MAEKSDPAPPVTAEITRMNLSDVGSAHAPFLYFEEASAFGYLNGVVRVTLEAVRTVPAGGGNGVINDRVVTAHLRMNIPAARSLIAALEGALLLATPSGSEAKN